MSEQELDVNEDSSDLETDLELEQELDQTDELAESSTALDVEDVESSSTEEDETIKVFESDKANQRFSEITTEAKEARAEAAANRAENEALRRQLEAMQVEVPAFDQTAPTLEQYEYDEERFSAATIAHEAAKAAHNVLANNRKATQQAIEQQTKQQLFEQHARKREALSAKRPDLAEALSSTYLNNQTVGGNATAEAILRADNGGDIEYHIAKNPELASRLNSMDQFAAIGEVARLSEKLKVKPKKREALPEPVEATPSGGGRTSDFQAKFSAGTTYE